MEKRRTEKVNWSSKTVVTSKVTGLFLTSATKWSSWESMPDQSTPTLGLSKKPRKTRARIHQLCIYWKLPYPARILRNSSVCIMKDGWRGNIL
jgi:hypothetical protein